MLKELVKLYDDLPDNPFRENLIRAYYYAAIVSEEEDELACIHASKKSIFTQSQTRSSTLSG